jgi:RES domain-containing protein
MQFDPSRYKADTAYKDYADASLEDGALLFRISSYTHSDTDKILTGNGAAQGTHKGRFHTTAQRATYCANNVLVCVAEVLYHMYRGVLDGIRDRVAPSELASRTEDQRVLTVLAVNRIPDLVYADSKEAASLYAPHITGPSITCPDSVYDPLHVFSDAVRVQRKNGIVYPSARHSQDLAFALFRDETSRIKRGSDERLEIKLRLVGEHQDLHTTPPVRFRIFEEKLHPTMGYYEFTDSDAFAHLKANNRINPDNLPERGYVDFVRRRYPIYPDKACIQPSVTP